MKSGVTSPVIWVISIVTLFLTRLITTHEPPSRVQGIFLFKCTPHPQLSSKGSGMYIRAYRLLIRVFWWCRTGVFGESSPDPQHLGVWVRFGESVAVCWNDVVGLFNGSFLSSLVAHPH